MENVVFHGDRKKLRHKYRMTWKWYVGMGSECPYWLQVKHEQCSCQKGKNWLGDINEIIESRSQRVILLFYSVRSDSIWITMSNFGHNWSKRIVTNYSKFGGLPKWWSIWKVTSIKNDDRILVCLAYID